MRTWLALSLTFTALAGAAAAQTAHPDLTGVWMPQPNSYLGAKFATQPRLTPAVLAQKARRDAAQKAGYVREVSGMICGQNGGPNMFQVRSPFEIFAGFGRMTFIFETEMNNQPRTIYMEQTVQPPNIYPTYNGHSIGRWEGRTLVIDTVGFTERGHLLGPVPRTATTHTVERLDMAADGMTLTDRITIDDPASLLEPWTTTLNFDRKPNTEERFEVWCDADLQALSTLDLPKLKDADPEIARLLDGSDTDPAVVIAKANAAGK